VFSTTPQELLDMPAPEKKGTQKQDNQVANPAPKEAAPNTGKKSNTTKNPKDVNKQGKKGKANKAEDAWPEDDVTAALMQLQVGASNIKEQSSISSKPMNSTQLQQQAMAHVTNSASKAVHATNTPVVVQAQDQIQGTGEEQIDSRPFTQKMAEARVRLNLSYPKICKMLGIRTIQYIQIESGAVQPSAELRAKICELFQIN
jgi:DNA-binding XRE family transcriptional regulator